MQRPADHLRLDPSPDIAGVGIDGTAAALLASVEQCSRARLLLLCWTEVPVRGMLSGLGACVLTVGIQAQGRATIRFVDMDANHDGVITRTEWRGSDRSFRNHDWNGDGRLSGDEVPPAGRRAAASAAADPFDAVTRSTTGPRRVSAVSITTATAG